MLPEQGLSDGANSCRMLDYPPAARLPIFGGGATAESVMTKNRTGFVQVGIKGVLMTLDKSLKVRRGMAGVRSVLTRAERLLKLKEDERWKEGQPVLGLPKVRVMKISLKKKKKTKEEGEATAATAKGGKGAKKK